MRKSMQTIKNPKGQIYDFRSYIDVDIKKEMEDITKIMQVVHQKLIENTGIPMNRLQMDLANIEGDIGTETDCKDILEYLKQFEG